MLDVVNVVASGAINTEFDLKRVAPDIGSIAEYNPDKHPGVYIRFDDEAPLITLYRTGKYIVTGADSKNETYATRERFLTLLVEKGMIESPDDDWFHIQNLVCTGELSQSLNLNALAIGLGLEVTEYEPEQFPGLVYRPAEATTVVLLFASGRVVITGNPNLDSAERTFTLVRDKVEEILTAD